MVHKHYLALIVAMAPAFASAVEPNGTAIEYFNSFIGHYFVTADPAEAGFIDSGGAGPGWSRTGGSFNVFRNAGDAPGISPVCRFYGTPGIGPNSHFYTSEPGECELVKADRGWSYEGTAFYIMRVNGTACATGSAPLYRSYNNGYLRNDSNHRFTTDASLYAKSASFGYQAEGVVMCSPLSAADKSADAVRLLRQGSFGPTPAETARVASFGAAAWVEEQLAMSSTRYPDYPYTAANRPAECVDDRTQPIRADSFCARDNYTLYPMQLQFFRNAITAPDQLRQRVAFALSQLMVTSGVDNSRNYAMARYQQMLADRAFGNYYDLLQAVTLSPMMGDYLDMANNNKTNVTARTTPNENYAREVMQLFSLGTYVLEQDGSKRLDGSGRPLFTYDQATVEGFAAVFTGWTYATIAGAAGRNNNPRNYLGEMRPVDTNHEFASKVLLGGTISPSGLTMQQDLAAAHRNIFDHPNVGPFVGRHLIRMLVTSDPSPAYVARVSAAFANNGAGIRGDLRAVVRTVLLDPEARGRKLDPAFGKLTEPVLYLTGIARALNASTDGSYLRAQSAVMGQSLFYSPSVFNYFPAEYVVPGTGLPGPEFGLLNSATAFARANVANTLVYTTSIAPDANLFGAIGTRLDLSRYQALAGDAGALTDQLDRDLLAGTMGGSMRNAIVAAVNAVAASDTLGRARAAIYLVVTSPQYQVQR
ncbi:MAG: DUF1800 family protein [Usitatibacter sp.]